MDVGSRSDGRGERQGRMVCHNYLGDWARRAESFLSSMRDKESFLAMEETMIRSFEVGVEGLRVGESISKFLMQSLAFVIVPFVHGARSNFWGDGSETSGVGEGFECCFPNGK